MTDNQNVNLESLINRFKRQIYREYGVEIYIMKAVESEHKCTLDKYKEITLKCIRRSHPKYSNYTFKTRTRERDFLTYVQAMSFLAHNDGYSLTAIAESIHRTHATVINSCNMIKNGLDTKDKKILKTLTQINNKLDTYVGTISTNVIAEAEPKPVSDPIWDAARRFINS